MRGTNVSSAAPPPADARSVLLRRRPEPENLVGEAAGTAGAAAADAVSCDVAAAPLPLLPRPLSAANEDFLGPYMPSRAESWREDPPVHRSADLQGKKKEGRVDEEFSKERRMDSRLGQENSLNLIDPTEPALGQQYRATLCGSD